MPRLMLLVAVATLFALLGVEYGFVRTAIGLGLAGLTTWLGFSYFRAAGEIPPEPEEAPTGSGAPEFVYLCRMCGLELKVEGGPLDRPPTHCREKMELQPASGTLRRP